MNEKQCSRLKFLIIIGVSTTLFILIGWHLYAHFQYKAYNFGRQEIEDFTRQLYKLELKRNPYLVKINFQGKTDQDATDDKAPQPLLQVDESTLSMPQSKTTSLLRRLYDNYELSTSIAENVTAEERMEELDFLKAILNTSIMKKTMEFLEYKEIVNNTATSHLEYLRDIWFTPYTRKTGPKSSSGFEHIFLGEIRHDTVLGLHNWLYFSEQERLGNLDYKGYIEKETLTDGSQYILTFRCEFFNITKVYNGIFVGTSPELEISLYTICFALRAGKPCHVQLGEAQFKIITWPLDREGKNVIGSAYPSLIE